MSITRVLYIDDRDPAITYSSISPAATGRIWRIFRGAGEEFMQTTSHANQTGAMAQIIFTGSDISVFGSVSPASTGFSDPLTHYILDSKPPLPFRPVPNNDTQYNVTFYESPKNLTSGPHILQIVLQSVGNYWLDYMMISRLPSTLSAAVNETLITSATTKSTSIGTKVYTPTLLSSPESSTTVSGELIASAVLGGILGFVLLSGLVVVIFRWKFGSRPHDPENILTPFGALTRGTDDSDRAQASELAISPSSMAPSGHNKRWRVLMPSLQFEPPPVYRSPRV